LKCNSVSSSTDGDAKLYLKGEGSLAVIELFGRTDVRDMTQTETLPAPNGVSDELDDLRYPADGKNTN
jgi:hypothetical protein